MNEKKWLSEYEKCDICGDPIRDVADWFVDGKTVWGPWALMDEKCFRNHGIGLGCGLGQKYDGKTAKLLEGGCDDTDCE